MRKITRRPLSESARERLTTLTTEVSQASDKTKKAKSHWDNRTRNRDFREIRGTLEQMASGRSRCMYCEDSYGTAIEHFWPKDVYPERAFDWDNYLLACSHCNSNQKRTLFPLDAQGNPLLIDPTKINPAEHLIFLPSTGEFDFRDAMGKESIDVFGLNDHESVRNLPEGRRDAMTDLIALLKMFDQETAANGDTSLLRRSVVQHPFSAVLHWLVALAEHPAGVTVLGEAVVSIVQRHHLKNWLAEV